MCGRYAASKKTDELVEELEVVHDATGDPTRSVLNRPQTPPPGQPDHNVAPTKQARVVLTRERDGRDTRQLRLLTWGLVPGWAKDPKAGARMANARAETVWDKPSFARAAKSRRALVPMSGWYEWQASPVATDAKGKPKKQPFFTSRADEDVLTVAAIYEFWRDKSLPEDDPLSWLVTFAVLTQDAEPGLDRIHDRQPVVVERADWARWLDPQVTQAGELADILAPKDPGRFTAWPVSTRVNVTANNGPELLVPVPRSELQGVIDPMTGEVIGEGQ